MYEGKHIHYSELDNKPLCSYSPKLCKQRRLNGYAFCIRHVLEDRSAPFRQCEYVAKYNSQRCTNPIPKAEERRYCNSHLQVMGVLPKKRKKKQDSLECLSLNITLPSMKPPNGLDHLPPSPPPSLPSLFTLDPFGLCRVQDVLMQDSPLKKPQGYQDPVRHKPKTRTTIPLLLGQAKSSVLLSCPIGSGDLALQSVCQQTLDPGLIQQGLLCKSVPAHISALAEARPVSTSHKSDRVPKSPNRKSSQCSALSPYHSNTSCAISSGHRLKTPKAACLRRFQQVMQAHTQKHGDLCTRLGLEWSEESEEDDEVAARVASYHCWMLRDKLSFQSAQSFSSRRHRLAGLGSYLRQKYSYLRREENALRRQSNSQHAVRNAMLHAAMQDPENTAQIQQTLHRTASGRETILQLEPEGRICSASSKGERCWNQTLPFTKHCFQHVLLNHSQQLFSSCTARFADGTQCSVPVFNITHQTPLCNEHAKKMDDFLRGDVNRRAYYHHQQMHKPLRKPRPTVANKKNKKKAKRCPRRPQKPIPPSLPQGNLGMPSLLCLPMHPANIRSPLTPDLSADEFPDDIGDIPHDLELNQEDFSDVLPRLPDDLHDFDLFEGKNSELLPTSEEADELVRVLQAMGSYPESLVCLSGMGDLGQPDGAESRGLPVGVVDLLSSRLSADTFSSLELETSLLHPTEEDGFPPSPLSPQPPLTPPSSVRAEGMFQRRQLSELQVKPDTSRNIQEPAHTPWNTLPLNATDTPSFYSVAGAESFLLSTSLSTPADQPVPPPSALPNTITAAVIASSSFHIISSSSPPSNSMSSLAQLKHTSPQLLSHCGIPADLQPHHSSPAPPMDHS
ncbi:INO80 complex subunit D-B isoform X3 [Denticeps clupeoides]|uniref:INO80 complex subunit D-B isoform X3 n=1 Tax=Denticeps clupeoides TaxID=299321 RepID=UPI0010A350A6|nr:INO80 complex subunit D isoform X3 [Denticeps clupeoides]